MKSSLLKKTIKVSLLLITCLFINNAIAQTNNTSVNITVKAVPVVTATSPNAICPDANTSYTNGVDTTPTHTFNIPTDASVVSSITTGTVSWQYTEVTSGSTADWDNATLISDPTQFIVNAGTTRTVRVRASVASTTSGTTCWSDDVLITLTVYGFPQLAITEPTGRTTAWTVCAQEVVSYATNVAASTYTWSILEGSTDGGVITSGTETTATPEITWAENTTGANKTTTLQLIYTTSDNCTYTVTQNVTIQPRPEIIIASTIDPLCYPASNQIDLTQYIASVDAGNAADIIYSKTSDFSGTTYTATQASAFDVSSFATAGGTQQIWVKIANSGECESAIQTFILTIYSQITANLVITNYSPSTTDYEECANTNGTAETIVTMNITIGGGCPTTGYDYTVVLGNTSTLDIDIAGTPATGQSFDSGTNTLTIPLPVGTTTAAGIVTVPLIVSIPPTGATGSINVISVTQTGANPCDCSRNTWN